jgi:hypothetical protein
MNVWGHEPEQRRHADEPRILDPAARVLVDPERERQPEDGGEEQHQVPDQEPGTGGEEVVRAAECARDHNNILPIK